MSSGSGRRAITQSFTVTGGRTCYAKVCMRWSKNLILLISSASTARGLYALIVSENCTPSATESTWLSFRMIPSIGPVAHMHLVWKGGLASDSPTEHTAHA
jgi:hypothetical protein